MIKWTIDFILFFFFQYRKYLKYLTSLTQNSKKIVQFPRVVPLFRMKKIKSRRRIKHETFEKKNIYTYIIIVIIIKEPFF